tara:strand:- start:33 stop:2978 length:2946 start_codon:yes stop_codon:yes gene_type:complete
MDKYGGLVKRLIVLGLYILLAVPLGAYNVVVEQDKKGFQLLVDNNPFLVRAVHWEYLPHDSVSSYYFWGSDDGFIKDVLDYQMPLLSRLGINTICFQVGVPARWVSYIYETYGIYSVVQYALDDVDFSDREILADVIEAVRFQALLYQDTLGFLYLLLGNDKVFRQVSGNIMPYHVATAKPVEIKVRKVYSFYGDAIDALEEGGFDFPVAVVGLPFAYLDLINQYCPNADIISVSLYHANYFTRFLANVHDRLGMPVFFHGIGADSHHAKFDVDDHVMQAVNLKEQWQLVYSNWYHNGFGNSLGAAMIHWADRRYLSANGVSSWAEPLYGYDFYSGENNVNGEWFGIVSKQSVDYRGFYEVVPRTSYYILQKLFRFNYEEGSVEEIVSYWDSFLPSDYSYSYSFYLLQQDSQSFSKLYLSRSRLYLGSGAKRYFLSAEKREAGYDYFQSLYTTLVIKPAAFVDATIDLNFAGRVSDIDLNQRVYESRYQENGGGVSLYRAFARLDEPYFKLFGFYRYPYYELWDQADFFNLIPSDYDLDRLDAYQSKSFNGVMVKGRRFLNSVTLMMGPELYEGANPMILLSYRLKTWLGDTTTIFQYDFDDRSYFKSLYDIGYSKTAKVSFHLKQSFLGFTLNIGGLAAGFDLLDKPYDVISVSEGDGYLNSGYDVDRVSVSYRDLFGGKCLLERDGDLGRVFFDLGYLGLLANGGYEFPSLSLNRLGLKPVNRGNQAYFHSGFSFNVGSLSISPSVIYQKPLRGPRWSAGLPSFVDGADSRLGLRNHRDHFFSVFENRYMVGGDLWFVRHDSRETLPYSSRVGLVYRDYRTHTDGFVSVNGSGELYVVGSIPAGTLFDGVGEFVFYDSFHRRLAQTYYVGYSQSRAGDSRMRKRAGILSELVWDRLRVENSLLVNDFGPYYDFVDQGFTYPFQFMLKASIGKELASFDGDRSEYGVSLMYRTLNQDSLYGDDFDVREEVSISMYLQLAI